jgi:predicted ATP-grasp superfamily ATP-dependent carboligase
MFDVATGWQSRLTTPGELLRSTGRSGTEGATQVLVLDSNSQAGLALIRSLGCRGLSVTAGDHQGWSLGMGSKHADDRFVHPDPDEDGPGFIEALREHLAESTYFAVFSVLDKTTALLSKHKPELEATDTTVAVEDWETFRQAYDKARTFALADALEVPTPATFTPESVAETRAIADSVPYPAVVKSRSKSVWAPDGTHHLHRVRPSDYVDGPDELVERYRGMLDEDGALREYPPIVQEYVPGETTTTVVLADEGDIRAYFQERRLRTFPAAGGNSTLLDGVDEPRMAEYARRLIGELGWTGPAQVEFMCAPDGEFYLIEMNGRYWGSLPLAINSGVDFPWLHYQLLQGLALPNQQGYRTDVVQRRLLYGDLKWLVEQFQARNVAALWPFLAAFLTARHTFVSLRDPVPTVLALQQALAIGWGALTGEEPAPQDQW